MLDHPGESLTWYGFFTDKTLDRTVESMRACGWQGVDLTDLSGMDANEVVLVVEHETDESGAIRPRVRWVNSQGGLAMSNALAGDDLAAFAATMRGRIAALDPRQARSKPTQRPAPAPRTTPATTQRRAGTPDGRPEPPPISDNIPF